MNKKLILIAFEKAKIKKQKEGIKKPSQTDLSEELANFINENEGFKLGERSFRDYYNDAKKLSGEDSDISIKQLKVINGLCKYIGFDHYQAFLKNVNHDKEKSKFNRVKVLIKENKVVLSITSLIIITFIVYNSVTKQRWMIWQDDHYVEVKFDIDKYNLNQLKSYKEERILYFKQIIPNCNQKFFKDNGTENLWYGKNQNKELEYFTALGLHPETEKTLKPITQYMIDKHICD